MSTARSMQALTLDDGEGEGEGDQVEGKCDARVERGHSERGGEIVVGAGAQLGSDQPPPQPMERASSAGAVRGYIEGREGCGRGDGIDGWAWCSVV